MKKTISMIFILISIAGCDQVQSITQELQKKFQLTKKPSESVVLTACGKLGIVFDTESEARNRPEGSVLIRPLEFGNIITSTGSFADHGIPTGTAIFPIKIHYRYYRAGYGDLRPVTYNKQRAVWLYQDSFNEWVCEALD